MQDENKPQERERVEREGIVGYVTELLLNTTTYKAAFSRLLFLTGVVGILLPALIVWENRVALFEHVAAESSRRWVLDEQRIKTTDIPYHVQTLREQYGAQSVVLWSFHNGTQTLSRSSVYSVGLEIEQAQLKNLSARLDEKVLIELFLDRCVAGTVNDSTIWSQYSKALFRKMDVYYNISCPVVVDSDLVGYISVNWDQESYEENISKYPLDEVLRSMTDLSTIIGSHF